MLNVQGRRAFLFLTVAASLASGSALKRPPPPRFITAIFVSSCFVVSRVAGMPPSSAARL